MAFVGAIGAGVENLARFFVAALDEDSAVAARADSGVGAGQFRADFEHEGRDSLKGGDEDSSLAGASDGDVEKAALFGEWKRVGTS